MRDALPIPIHRLQACLAGQFGLPAAKIDYLPRGHDFSAGVYRAGCDQGAYLLKVTRRPLYAAALSMPRWLNDQGIEAVVAPLPTSSGALWTALDDWRVILYPWIDGVSTFEGMSRDQWRQTGDIFRSIHAAPLPADAADGMRGESFDPSGYARSIRRIESESLPALEGVSGARGEFRNVWERRRAVIHRGVEEMERLAAQIGRAERRRVICHADLHPANLLRDPAGRVHVIDWDEVMLAPCERDFIFVRGADAQGFWEGYGRVEVDRDVLAYYLWERTITDVIEDAYNVCENPLIGEEFRAEVVRLVDQGLAEVKTKINAEKTGKKEKTKITTETQRTQRKENRENQDKCREDREERENQDNHRGTAPCGVDARRTQRKQGKAK